MMKGKDVILVRKERCNISLRFTFALIILIWSMVNGQWSMAQSPKELLDLAASKAFAEGYVDIDFTVHMAEGEASGSVLVQGKQFVLDTPGMKTWFDGKTQWTYVEANDEVSVSEPTAEELQALNPYAWVSLYQQDYTLKFGETAVPNVRKVIMTTTVPREEMQSIVLLLHEKDLYPVRISMASRGGLDVVVIDVDKYEVHKQPLPTSTFAFNKADYPDVDVIDLR